MFDSTTPNVQPEPPQPVQPERKRPPNVHLSRCAGSDCEADQEPAPDVIRDLPPGLDQEVATQSMAGEGAGAQAPQPKQEPEPASPATAELDALTRLTKVLDNPLKGDLAQSLIAALMPLGTTPNHQLAEAPA